MPTDATTDAITEAEQRRKWDLRMRKLDAEIANLNAATERNIRENRFPPVVIAAAIVGIAGPIGLLLLTLGLGPGFGR